MELKVYAQLLDWRRRGVAVSVGRLQEWSHEVMKVLFPEVKWKGSQRWSERFRKRWNLSVRMKTKVAQKTQEHVVVGCQANWWMEATGVIQWLDVGVVPFLKPKFGVQSRSAMLVLDSYRGHLTKEVKARFAALNIVPAVILAGCTADVQPLDVSLNKSFKASFRQQYQSWFEADGMNILTPAGRPVAVSLADPSRGPVLANYSTVLPCPAAPSGSLSVLYLPSFSTNLVSGADLQDGGVDQFTLASQRVTHCTCARTSRHLATLTRRPGSSLYTLTTESPPVAASGQVAASSQVFAAASRSGPESAPCSCRLLSHQTLLWQHRIGHPSLPRLQGMASRVLVSGLPRSLPPLPPDPTPTCVLPYSAVDREDLSADKLSSRAVPCVFLGFPPDAPGWQFYHPTSRRVLSSQDVTFDKLVPYYHAVEPFKVAVDSCASGGAEPERAEPGGAGPAGAEPESAVPGGAGSGGAEPEHAVEPFKVAVDSCASGGAEPERAEPGGAGPAGAEPESAVPGGARSGGAEPERAEPGGAGSGGAEPGVAESGGAAPAGAGPAGSSGALSRRELPSPQELREWFARRWSRAAGARGAAGAGGSPSAGGAGATGPGGARTGGTGAAGLSGATGAGVATSPGGSFGAGAAGGTGAGGAAGAGAPVGAGVGASGAAGGTTGAGGAAGARAAAGGAGIVPAGSGGAARPPLYFVPLLEQVLGLPPSSGPTPSSECPPPRREPESHPASPVRTARTSRRVPQSFLPVLADPEPDSLCAASQTVTRFLATAITDPSFESAAASALVAELVDFAAHCRLDYATSLVAESASVCPPFVGGECALSTDVLEDRQEEFQCFAAALTHLVSTLFALEGDPDAPDIPTPRSYAEAIEGPYSSQWQAAMDAEMASWKSTGTYVDKVPPPGANIVSGLWIFRVKRPPGSPPVFKARYVARGFNQHHGVDYFQTFSPTPKITTLRVLLHVAAQRDYELHSLDFSTAFLQGSLHEEIWLRRPPGFTGSFPLGTQTALAALGFASSTADPSLFLRTDTLLPPFYILVYVLQRFDFTYSSPQATPLSTRHSLSALPSDESLEPSGAYPELVGCLMCLMTCTRPDLAYPLNILARYVAPGRHQPEHMAAVKRVLRYLCSTSGMGLVLGGRSPVVLTGYADASWVDDLATQQSSQSYTFSLGSGSVSWRSTRSTSVLSSTYEAEIYVGAMAAQELRWLTYLLTDLGEPPRSPPVLYVDNKAMLALCREHILEHRTKHIALRYFLARKLQQRGQLSLAYVASEANTADIFTKALPPGDHQRFCTMLACFALLCLTGLMNSCSPPLCLWGAMAAQELRWLTYLLNDLGEQPRSPPVLYVDNKAMIALCQEHRLEHRTKHIALQYFLARELQQRGQLCLAYVATRANTADVFTKAFPSCDHQRFSTVLLCFLDWSCDHLFSPTLPLWL
ncbi:unnamed protein product [Closterium sp. NIES-53]